MYKKIYFFKYSYGRVYKIHAAKIILCCLWMTPNAVPKDIVPTAMCPLLDSLHTQEKIYTRFDRLYVVLCLHDFVVLFPCKSIHPITTKSFHVTHC